jgi:glycosyltransferase involved in cell wall biosynthesis
MSKKIKYNIEIITIHENERKLVNNLKIHYILPKWAKKTGIFRYIIGGIKARHVLRNNDIYLLHAHNTSGYGLMALLSGFKYIVTTYGSEIYRARSRGKIYRFLIKKILDKSQKVTASSIKMSRELESSFSIDPNKINLFSLGVDRNIFYRRPKPSLSDLHVKYNIKKSDKIWIINRRVLPLYNTNEVIRGFLQFTKQSKRACKLFVICGEYDADYLADIQALIEGTSSKNNVFFIKEFLSQNEIAKLLSIGDFSISVPNTDQLSSSILESISCCTIPILSDIEAYESLKNKKIALFAKDLSAKGFYDIFLKTSSMTEEDKVKITRNGCTYINDYRSERQGLNSLVKLYSKNQNLI